MCSFGALGDDPSPEGDQTSVEICDVCGNAVADFTEIDGLIVCDDCREDLSLVKNEDTSSPICVICGWPINRLIEKQEVEKFCRGVLEWVKKNTNSWKIVNNIKKKLERIEGKTLAMCRYDFFYFIKDLISSVDEKLGEKYEKEVCLQYDFRGSLIS